jgi:two-component system sensor histidine kinase KdpD
MSRAWTGYAWAVGATLAATLAGYAMQGRFDLVNIAMVYLVAVVMVALYRSRGAAVAASILCVAAFDVLFVPPAGTFTVHDAQYLLTFAIMLGVGLIISRLVDRVRRQTREQALLEVEAETERVRSALLASISHDLRTPLAVMAGASSTLVEAGERMQPSARQALARSVFDHARDLSERVSKLLQMTRLDTGAIRIERDWTSIVDVADSAVRRLSDRLAAHRLIVEIPDDLPLVRVDAALIEQALGNLLENAAKHTPPGTIVRLRAKAAGERLVLSVEDHGGDATDVDLERIFRKFQHGSMEGTAGGVGLGLAICRAIVRLHGGDSWAERTPGGGMTFRIGLPLELPPQVPAETSSASDGRATDDPRR